jgi:tetratricopeptide (TPR) repeat protein
MPDDQVSPIPMDFDVRRIPPSLTGSLLIVGLVLLAYLPAMSGGFIWDDDSYVQRNPVIKVENGLELVWKRFTTPQYYPLVFSSFWLEYHAWGLDPMGYHVVNVLLHAANALLLWVVLRRLGVAGAWLAAAIFALHPVHVESVAWITERKNVLSGFFYLLSMLSYIRFAGLERGADAQRRLWISYAFSLLFFAAALFSKTVTCSLPAVLCLLLWWRRERVRIADFIPLVPMFVMGAAMAFVTSWQEHHIVGDDRINLGLAPLDRVVLAGQGIWFYLGKIFWPHPLAFMYDKWTVDYHAPRQWIAAMGTAILLGVLFLCRRQIGKAPLVAGLFFCGTLLPALGFFDVFPMTYSWVADHFQYLASIGPIVLFSATVVYLLGKFSPSNWRSIPVAVILLILGGLTWNQGHIYKNLETLWRDTIAKTPTAWMAYNNLGTLLLDTSGAEAALPFVERSIQLNPRHAPAYLNMAIIRLDQGRGAEALTMVEKAREFSSQYDIDVQYALALVLTRTGRQREALEMTMRVLKARPNHAQAHFLQGRILLKAGELREAEASFRRTLLVDPEFVEAQCFLADTLASEHRTDEALKEYEGVITRAPDNFQAYLNCGNVLVGLGRWQDALRMAQQALVLRPNIADAHNLMGVALMGLERREEAIGYLTEAVRLDPRQSESHFNLANALNAIGRTKEAIEQYEQVLRINPADGEARTLLESSRRAAATQPGV